MKTRTLRMSLFTIAAIALLGLASIAVAGPGYGRYHMGWGGNDGPPADCPRWDGDSPDGYGRGYGASRDVDDAQLKQYQEKREAFFKDTADLRQELIQKRLEMKAEFAKKSPDESKLSSLQKEISSLKGALDQKALAHRIEMKKSFPGIAAGYGNGRGYGRGYGRGMMDQGEYGRGMMGGHGPRP